MTTKIEWTDASWSPVVGCTKIATGCKNCYAERMAYRLACIGAAQKAKRRSFSETPLWKKYSSVVRWDEEQGKWSGKIFCDEKSLEIPLHWRKPRRIFVCSMSDLFHEEVPFGFIDEVLEQVFLNRRHTFQVLTKRPERMLKYYTKVQKRINRKGAIASNAINFMCQDNLWLGVSISTQEDADKNIPILLQIPAAVRFVSVEPMLGNVIIDPYLHPIDNQGRRYPPMLDWVIVGGESGPGARPMHPDWPRSIRDQCVAAGVPFFFKQWGRFKPSQKGTIAVKDDGSYQRDPTGKFEWKRGYAFEKMLPLGKKKAGRLLDGKEWNEYPKVRGER